MAPELALKALGALKTGAVVLDPMTGSGTVLRQAVEFGHTAFGFDVDPLAVLMSNVWSSNVNARDARIELWDIIERVKVTSEEQVDLPWQENDDETIKFIEFWFASSQRAALRKLAYILHNTIDIPQSILNVFKLALSRIIVTKEQAASLARDTSHSRPHRVALENQFDVLAGFERSALQIIGRLSDNKFSGSAFAGLGDARVLKEVEDGSVDAIVTSPPYLNAIDYMRGHKLALVWLGYNVKDLRAIRTESIGAEKGLSGTKDEDKYKIIMKSMGDLDVLPARSRAMIERYTHDMCSAMSESKRVLTRGGLATYVVGNSCLKGVYIKNSEAVRIAGETVGLTLTDEYEREIPNSSRYLPVTGHQLAKRMRTETILCFKAA
ncbi:hypothetical protein ABENE_13060 [Asticcacaulis benevestitus DSM 16100 = ATCC BAA-896]|uniref:site-specific DNA-methyltransferase (cytosine-N(4)-specific) n=2 Tax=Asticcacaulis TaxID=76890 RepID=V4REW7_9CAUL|nr:hypothetical protein ABENE_13060 [Asticcacaulis benevestitus DSM 16100 = ATCC BAA-896]